MRGALTRRVLDMLAKLAGDKAQYQTFWNEFGQVLKEGLIDDIANKDKLANLLRFSTTHNDNDAQNQSLDEYLGRIGDDQEKIYYLLAENYATAVTSPHLEQLRQRGIEVLLLTDRIDGWIVETLAEYEGKSFVDVARAGLDLPKKDDEQSADEGNDKHKSLLERMQKALSDRVETVNVSRRLVDSPACVVASEQDLNPQVRRLLEASGQQLPESKPVLEVNIGHPLLERLSAESDDERFGELANIVLDHALLAEGTQLENPAAYVRRINKFLLG